MSAEIWLVPNQDSASWRPSLRPMKVTGIVAVIQAERDGFRRASDAEVIELSRPHEYPIMLRHAKFEAVVAADAAEEQRLAAQGFHR